jgi:hypothetical protein
MPEIIKISVCRPATTCFHLLPEPRIHISQRLSIDLSTPRAREGLSGSPPLLPRGFRGFEGRRLFDDTGAQGAWRGRHVACRGVSRAASARLLRAGDGARHQYAPLLGGAGRRSVAAGRPLALRSQVHDKDWRNGCVSVGGLPIVIGLAGSPFTNRVEQAPLAVSRPLPMYDCGADILHPSARNS